MADSESDTSAALREEISQHKKSFNLLLVILILVSTAAILGSILWRRQISEARTEVLLEIGRNLGGDSEANATLTLEERRRVKDDVTRLATEESIFLGPDLARDLAIAVFISAFVSFLIERYANDQLRRHITHDVLSAAYEKLVPAKIYTQVRDSVFRSDVYRKKWEVQIDAGGGVDANGLAIITSTISYDVENLNDHQISFEVLGAIDLDVPSPAGQNLPAFESIKVLDSSGQPLIDDVDVQAALKAQPQTPGAYVRKNNLAIARTNQELNFSAQIRIRAGETVKARFKVKRTIRVPGTYVLHATAPAEGITITTRTQGFSLCVIALHPNRQALQPDALDPNVWKFERGILPWQGFELRSVI